MMKKTINTKEDIKVLVDTFYGKVQEDAVLKDVFNAVIQDQWPKHMARMYTFWQTILLGDRSYYGNPFMPHAELPVEKAHFEQWLALFFETLDENFTGEKAEEAKWRAGKMAEMFQYKIAHYRQNNSKPLI